MEEVEEEELKVKVQANKKSKKKKKDNKKKTNNGGKAESGVGRGKVAESQGTTTKLRAELGSALACLHFCFGLLKGEWWKGWSIYK